MGFPLALVASTYLHVADSDGQKSVKSDVPVLIFHPTGTAFMVEVLGKKVNAWMGAYAFDRGNLVMHFPPESPLAELSTPFDLTASWVKLPFAFYSRGKGSSEWRRVDEFDRLAWVLLHVCLGVVSTREGKPQSAMQMVEAYIRAFLPPSGRSGAPSINPAPPMREISVLEGVGSSGVGLGFAGEDIGTSIDLCECFRHGEH